ncbi:hypothetical protein AcW1_001268 [Taiwanofungus camphoratus]|nr:hypothetical protein AcW2_000207 [Antrodia cinnamomea]KAI0962448.1 hypothetical protein AcV7_001290 [Antrodia cinnamomea]KAI0964451.1 hypothetical protein AcW1_001268 [Antrodia cinnamomea]
MSSAPKVVIVTGCSKGGIGFSLCEEFAAQGCKVYATARRVEAMEGFTHKGIEKLQLDVTNDQNVQEAVKTILEREGKIDVLVNNAGAPCHGPLLDISIEQVMKTFDTNVLSIVRMAQAVIPHMAARKSGVVVNIGSIVGEVPTPFSAVYSSTKASVKSISESLYMECLPFNVSVVHVSPGGVKSNIATNMMNRFTLPADSLYGGWLDQMVGRITQGQGPGSLPTTEFARRVVTATLSRRPPMYMTLGSYSRLFRFFAWLPRTWVLRFLWASLAGKPKTKAA